MLPKRKIEEILVKSRGLWLSSLDRKAQTVALATTAVFIFPTYVLMLWILPVTIFEVVIYTISLLLLGAIVLLALFIFRQKVPSSKRECRELALLEDKIEHESFRTISGRLGRKVNSELNLNLNSMDIFQTDLCTELLKQREIRNDHALTFYIYLRMYKFHFISEYFNKAVDALKAALAIYPDNVIVRIWLAEAYEYMGSGDLAVEEYEAIRKIRSISPGIEIYIDDQVKRVREKGPRKTAPISGLKYMTY